MVTSMRAGIIINCARFIFAGALPPFGHDISAIIKLSPAERRDRSLIGNGWEGLSFFLRRGKFRSGPEAG
jgi:hypothetical protein